MGTSGSTQDNVTIYVDSSIVASTAADAALYVAMENETTLVTISNDNSAALAKLWDGKMLGGPLGPFFVHRELTQSEIQDLYLLGVGALGLP